MRMIVPVIVTMRLFQHLHLLLQAGLGWQGPGGRLRLKALPNRNFQFTLQLTNTIEDDRLLRIRIVR